MMRRIVGAIALAAVVTTGARAQSPFQANFTVSDPGHLDFANYLGEFHAAGTPGSNPSLTGRLNETPFQVFCVDPTHFFLSTGDTYQVYVTPMSSGDFSKTRLGDAAAYFRAANIASNMPIPNLTNDAAIDNLQYAIWATLGFTVSPTLEDYSASAIASDLALSSGQGISKNQWLVVTMLNPNQNQCFLDRQHPCEQELIYNGPGRPKEVVPEPGTMAMLAMGLIGMTGVGIRRRKKA